MSSASESRLQDDFLRVFADGHRATARRIVSKLKALGIPLEVQETASQIVRDELRGLYHGNLVVFDGGSSLADHGLIKIVDDSGTSFARNLHEIGFKAPLDSDDRAHVAPTVLRVQAGRAFRCSACAASELN